MAKLLDRKRAERRKRKERNTYLGRSRDEEARLTKKAGEFVDHSRDRSSGAYNETQAELEQARTLQKQTEGDYSSDRSGARRALTGLGTAASGADSTLSGAQTSAAGLRNTALSTNPLTQTTEGTIAANTANANAQAAYQQQQVARQARGLAGSMGEGGALAMQQAVASSGAAQQNLAAQSNLQLAQQNAALRQGAAEQERQAALSFADRNAADAMGTGAARAELQFGAAGQQAQMAQNQQALTNQRSLALQSQRSGIAQNNAGTALAAEGSDKEYQSGLLTSTLAAGQERNKEEGRAPWKKALFPMGMLGN